MLVFQERGKQKCSEKTKILGTRRESTNSTHIYTELDQTWSQAKQERGSRYSDIPAKCSLGPKETRIHIIFISNLYMYYGHDHNTKLSLVPVVSVNQVTSLLPPNSDIGSISRTFSIGGGGGGGEGRARAPFPNSGW